MCGTNYFLKYYDLYICVKYVYVSMFNQNTLSYSCHIIHFSLLHKPFRFLAVFLVLPVKRNKELTFIYAKNLPACKFSFTQAQFQTITS